MGRHAKPKVSNGVGKRLLARATAVAAFATGGMLAQTNAAAAHNGHIHVAGVNDYGGLALRSEPNTGAHVHQRLNDGEGDAVSFLCIANGEQVDGLLSTNKWAKVQVPRADGTPQEGYMSLAYTDLLQGELGDMWGSWQIPDCAGGQGQARKYSSDDVTWYNNTGPDHATIWAEKNGDDSSIEIRFQLTPKQVENLQRASRYLEIDFPIRGYIFTQLPGFGWESYRLESNMPGAIHDSAFSDSGHIQRPAATGIRTADLQAEKEYFVKISWHEKRHWFGTPAFMANWVPSSWADGSRTQQEACLDGRATSNPDAWCYFPAHRPDGKEYSWAMTDQVGGQGVWLPMKSPGEEPYRF